MKIIRMLLRIISAEWSLYTGEVQKVTIPGEDGYLGILPWHINLVVPLVPGKVSYLPQWSVSSLESFADNSEITEIQGWLAMVENDVVTIVAD